MRSLRKRLTYANVMSTLAALFALGGGVAYAANTIASMVTGQKVANESLNGNDVVNNSLKGADIDESTLDIGMRRAPRPGWTPPLAPRPATARSNSRRASRATVT